MSKRAEALANDLDCLVRLNSGKQPILLKAEAAALIEAYADKRIREAKEARQ